VLINKYRTQTLNVKSCWIFIRCNSTIVKYPVVCLINIPILEKFTVLLLVFPCISIWIAQIEMHRWWLLNTLAHAKMVTFHCYFLLSLMVDRLWLLLGILCPLNRNKYEAYTHLGCSITPLLLVKYNGGT
jgi:hypothetical protein